LSAFSFRHFVIVEANNNTLSVCTSITVVIISSLFESEFEIEFAWKMLRVMNDIRGDVDEADVVS
jgi:hypothetical protein